MYDRQLKLVFAIIVEFVKYSTISSFSNPTLLDVNGYK
jgi:hypothetical protein